MNAGNCLLRAEGVLAEGMPQAVDLAIQDGQVWMLYGPSGCGKSQLLKALADLVPHQGQAWLESQQQNEICPESWRSQVMYFAAETAWWQDSVAAHFETLPSDEALQALGLQPAMLQANPDSLSSGEKQRLALLRGLAYQPKVLLLDEITANLDLESCLLVETLLKTYLSEGERAILWISHDVEQRARMATADTQLCFTQTGALQELQELSR